jgi:hypothetical protein
LSRLLEVRETIDKVRVYHKHALLAEHKREPEGARAMVIDKAHRTPGRRPGKNTGAPQLQEEKTLLAAAPELDRLVALLRKEGRGKPLRHIRKLYRFYIDYPKDALLKAVSRALEYGLTDFRTPDIGFSEDVRFRPYPALRRSSGAGALYLGIV